MHANNKVALSAHLILARTCVMRAFIILCCFVACLSSAVPGSAIAASVPSVALLNSAAPGQTMPAIGLGTGSYSDDPSVGYGGYPECASTLAGCGSYTEQAVGAWLSAGGRRLDCANSYGSQLSVGKAMAASGVPRADIFLLSKGACAARLAV